MLGCTLPCCATDRFSTHLDREAILQSIRPAHLHWPQPFGRQRRRVCFRSTCAPCHASSHNTPLPPLTGLQNITSTFSQGRKKTFSIIHTDESCAGSGYLEELTEALKVCAVLCHSHAKPNRFVFTNSGNRLGVGRHVACDFYDRHFKLHYLGCE